MRLTITPLTATETSFNVQQKFAVRATASLIGTRNLMNCLGVVLYNRLGSVGIVAHIEAQGSNAQYDLVANAVILALLTDLDQNGGGSGSLSLVLLGNRGSYKVAVDMNMFGFRLAPADFTDLRGQYGACILDPANETLYVDAFGEYVADGPQGADATMFAIQ